ncbi:hypothetical protein Sant_1074 [Sodalis praecaptivus]|uniref:Uncharacterized protein n=1 Tax=Sodalis praecaptivus TaxID=1239307 RepID=W0HUE1_9GAMM|nr:hypothetical protein [Sodalis praecaptivus]AHF76147.1 hypothetical protein Sant_1074 [Sodalis praecaptivus]
MSKKVTINFKDESLITAVDNFCHVKDVSRSAAFELVVKASVPFLNKITSYHYQARQIEMILLRQSIHGHISQIRGTPEITHEEFFLTVWNTHIKSALWIPSIENSQKKTNDGSMGTLEIKNITERLEVLVDTNRAKAAIHIHTDRITDDNSQYLKGYSNTILLKETSYGEYYFDINKIVVLPITELIIFGVKGVLKRKDIYFSHPYICWINIYHTNNLAVMLPIICKAELPQCTKNEKKIILINPFTTGSKK